MPIYEYRCQACDAVHEAIQKLSDAPLVDCPQCHASALRKQISAPVFRLKGGGWYETDFKTGDKKNLAGDTATGEKKSADGGVDKSSAKDSGGATKSDTKPSSKSDASGPKPSAA